MSQHAPYHVRTLSRSQTRPEHLPPMARTKKEEKGQLSLTGFVKGVKPVKSAAKKDSDDEGDDSDTVEHELVVSKKPSKASPDESDLPPINTIPAIFSDVVERIPELKDVSDHLNGRKLRVATMCSGTESPLLALGLIGQAMKDKYGSGLEIEHVFSCEIEPFKQAYIERNFSPPILFRDVCELGGEKALVYRYI